MTQHLHSFDWLFQQTPLALLVVDCNNQIISANESALALLGTKRDKLLTLALDDLFEEALNSDKETDELNFVAGGHKVETGQTQILRLKPAFSARLVDLCRRTSIGNKDEHHVISLTDLSLVSQTCRLDVVFGEAHRQILDGAAAKDILNDLCVGICDALRLPMMWLSSRRLNGNIEILATAHTGQLYKALIDVPERDDDSITGSGPCGLALRQQKTTLCKVTDEGYAPWRAAAQAENIKILLSVPLGYDDTPQYENSANPNVITFACHSSNCLGDEANVTFLSALSKRIKTLCSALAENTQQRIVNAALTASGNASFITDAKGNIVWANEAFARVSRHSLSQLIGQSPRILQSGKQGQRYYQRLWRTIQAGQVWSGETIDRDGEGELYTIRQTISPVQSQGEISHYISIHEDISDAKALQATRERARGKDEVTGLLTKASFEDKLEQAVNYSQRHGEPFAVLLLTMDNFEALLRPLGGDIEELVMETVGDRILGELNDDDFAVSMGGGDFIIVLRDIDSRKQAEAAGQNILDIMLEPYPLLGDKLYLPTTLGVALCPEDASQADALLQLADQRAATQSNYARQQHLRTH